MTSQRKIADMNIGQLMGALCDTRFQLSQLTDQPEEKARLDEKKKALTSALADLDFGPPRMFYFMKTIEINPGLFERVIKKTYEVCMCSLGRVQRPAIDLTQFIQVIRMIILKRLQDIHTFQHKTRPVNKIAILRSFEIPRPIGDILYALGHYQCKLMGIEFYFSPPLRPNENIPDWMDLDVGNWSKYISFMSQIKGRYQTIQYPEKTYMNGRPLMFVTKQEVNGVCMIRSYIKECKPEDFLLRFVHEDFFTNSPYTYDDCHLIGMQMDIASVTASYVGGYYIP